MTSGVVTEHLPRPSPTPAPPPRGRQPRPAAVVSAVLVLSVTGILANLALDNPTSPVARTYPIPSASERFPVAIRQPIIQPRVETGALDDRGQAVTVSCGSCHATSKPRVQTRTSAELDEFHQGLQYSHGTLSCLSCHNASNYDQLRLADGQGVPFAEAMSLCAQCHGPQFRDYSRGSHGGMTGYWDLSKGPRERNHCVDCHDPHAPRYPVVLPAFPLPPDRGYQPRKTHSP